jgi:pilus assembly protein CpaD
MMKLHLRLIAAALLLGMTACASQYTESEAPKDLTLDSASTRIDVRFAPGSSRLLAGDAARLRALVASGRINPSDPVTVSAGGSPALAAARFETVAAMLLPYRIVAGNRPLGGVPANRAIIQSQRYMVSLPPCPNWSRTAQLDLANAHASNWGCSTASNLGMMVASPADLAEGRPLGLADAIPAAAAVQRYQSDKVQLPAAAALTNIPAATSAPTGAGATGAGTAGTGP